MRISIKHLAPEDEQLFDKAKVYLKVVYGKSLLVRILHKNVNSLQSIGFSEQFLNICRKALKKGDVIIFSDDGKIYENFKIWR